MTTAAQQEFNDLVAKNTERETVHPEDRHDPELKSTDQLSEEDSYRNQQINDAMRAPTNDYSGLRLPPASFDSGRSTGVKGVIADARHFETARKSNWKSRVNAARRSIFGLDGAAVTAQPKTSISSDEDASEEGDDSFLQQWRESRRRQLEADANKEVRNRRTSPSVREYGRLDEVDMHGYLDAIEKVRRDTTVVVFVYDHDVSFTTNRSSLFSLEL
jgi:hypothetical protein